MRAQVTLSRTDCPDGIIRVYRDPGEVEWWVSDEDTDGKRTVQSDDSAGPCFGLALVGAWATLSDWSPTQWIGGDA